MEENLISSHFSLFIYIEEISACNDWTMRVLVDVQYYNSILIKEV